MPDTRAITVVMDMYQVWHVSLPSKGTLTVMPQIRQPEPWVSLLRARRPAKPRSAARRADLPRVPGRGAPTW